MTWHTLDEWILCHPKIRCPQNCPYPSHSKIPFQNRGPRNHPPYPNHPVINRFTIGSIVASLGGTKIAHAAPRLVLNFSFKSFSTFVQRPSYSLDDVSTSLEPSSWILCPSQSTLHELNYPLVDLVLSPKAKGERGDASLVVLSQEASPLFQQ